MMRANPSSPQGILVTDFDGTLTHQDFFQVALEKILPPDLPDYWNEYRSGRQTHFEMLQAIYGAIRVSEESVIDLLPLTRLEPRLAELIQNLKEAGWRVMVASAGCSWYIEKLFQQAGIELEVHANPGEFISGRGLQMQLPRESPYFSPTHGIDKAAVVRHHLQLGIPVAFAGDGYPDLDAALLVSSPFRFARAALAESLDRLLLPYHPFEHWHQVADQLLKPASHSGR